MVTSNWLVIQRRARMQIFIAVRVRENLGDYGEWTSVRVEYDYEVYFGGMVPRIHTIINTDTKKRVNVTNINEEDMELIFKEIDKLTGGEI